MKIVFFEAPYNEEVKLNKETLDYLGKKKYSKIALFSSVQFLSGLEGVREQLLQRKIEVVVSTADRASAVGQLLGCDCNYSNLNLQEEVDAFLYIGDGKFHPLALLYAQRDRPEDVHKGVQDWKEVICYDPRGKMTIIGKKEIEMRLNRYRGSLMKFLSAQNVGVIITVKPGQQQLKAALMLEKKYPAKRFYYFLDDTISLGQLENFPFVDVWVNTACPRISFDEGVMFRKGVVNLRDAMYVKEILGREKILT